MVAAKRPRSIDHSAVVQHLTSILEWLHHRPVEPDSTPRANTNDFSEASLPSPDPPLASARLRLVEVEQTSIVAERPSIRAPRAAREALMSYLGRKDREYFAVLHLDGAHQLISTEIVSVGTLTASLVHPREVFKGALLANAACIICAHNHPSGRVQPSHEDHSVMNRLKQAGELLGVPLLDFLIVSSESYWSDSESR